MLGLPHDFPPWSTVYHYYRQWRLDGTWDKIHDSLREQVRQSEERNIQPSGGIIDSQSVKTTEKVGFVVAGKKIKGRKRPILVDTLGLLLLQVGALFSWWHTKFKTTLILRNFC